ncbi:MAG: DEAD/DEAH box helicase [Acidobacteria bacterium]|nr:DEAD/DEAH box helicase [Acidobacteriota bacterium]
MHFAPDDGLTLGTRVLVRGHIWTIVGHTAYGDCASISLRGCDGDNDGRTQTILTPFDRVLPAVRPISLHVVGRRRLLHHVRSVGSQAHPAAGLRTAAAAAIDIIPYQLEPAMAVGAGATRLMIADAVGLGKTIQAGLILSELAARDESFRAIVAAPAGLREQWQQELEHHFRLPSVVADAAWLARAVRHLPPDVNPWALPAIYVASLDFLKRAEVLKPLEELTWDALIVDEAHNATLGTARRAALHGVGVRARRVVLLTATPHTGDSGEYDALGRLGACGDEDVPIVTFRRTRERIGPGPRRRTTMLAVRLSPAERRMHRLLDDYTTRLAGGAGSRARLAAIVLRKRALSSAASLAASASRRLALLAGAPVEDTRQLALPFSDEDPLDDEVRDEMLAAPGMADAALERALLTAIIQAAACAAEGESKIRLLARLLTRTGEPAIVFTEFRDTLTRLQMALADAGVSTLALHGGQSPAERGAVRSVFNATGSVLLATDAASEGLNLQSRCRLVVHYELPWTPSRLEQRTGRVDRIGQRRRVHEILLVARDTAERMVLAPLAARARRARSALEHTSRVLDLLTESRVAAAVMDGESLPGDPSADGEPPASPWEGAAIAEADRIGLLRHLHSSTSKLQPYSDVVVCGPVRRGRVREVVAVYGTELVARGGRVEHTEVQGVRAAVQAEIPRTAAALRAWAAAWLGEEEPRLREQFLAGISDRLTDIAAGHQEAVAALQRRERAIAAQFSSVARDLVQAGLFDRRAIRASEARRRVSRELLEASEVRQTGLSNASELTPRLRLLALILR